MMAEDAMDAESQPAGRARAEEQSMEAHEDAGTDADTPAAQQTSETMTAQAPPDVKRNASSKFASLRAAFENKAAVANGSPDSGQARKLLTSSSDLSVGKTRERTREYEAEIAQLRNELEKERELRVANEDKMGKLEMDMDEVNKKMLKQAEALEAAVVKLREMERLEDARVGDDEDSLDGEGKETDSNHTQDSAALRRQLSDLKRSISRSARPTGQLTDTTLRQEIGLLQHEMQNWVVNHFRKVKSQASPAELCEKLDRIAEPEQVERLRPLYEAFDAAAKLAIYQATVAAYMMEIFSDRFLFGLRGQHDWAKRTRQAAETLPAALDAATYSQWRAVTFSALTQAAALKEPVESAVGAMAEMICITLNAMTEMEESEARLHSLRTIVRRAILLAHSVRSQQAQYEFVLPAPGDAFKAASMDDIVDDAETDEERAVRCATFPSLFKSADDEGAKLEPKKVVFRAKVLCKGEEDG